MRFGFGSAGTRVAVLLGVVERLIEAGFIRAELAGFEDGAAIEALHILRIRVFGDQLRAKVFAIGGIGHRSFPKKSAKV
jgi:hypothetical protein